LIMCGLAKGQVLEAVRVTLAEVPQFKPQPVADYLGGAVSHKVLRIILGYIDFVNQNVWRKPIVY